EPDPDLIYFVLLSVFHEDMHTEAFTYTRQTLGYPAPCFTASGGREPASSPLSPLGRGARREGVSSYSPSPPTPLPSGERGEDGPLPGDVFVPGGTFQLGATQDELFVFDNERWAHPVELKPFAIARAPVTQAEFAAFVDDGGYRRREFWSEEGWRWRGEARGGEPVCWARGAGGAATWPAGGGWSGIGGCCTSAGTKRRRIVAGPAAGCPPRRSGRPPRRPSPPAGAHPCRHTSAVTRGATSRPTASGRTSTAMRWAVSMWRGRPRGAAPLGWRERLGNRGGGAGGASLAIRGSLGSPTQ